MAGALGLRSVRVPTTAPIGLGLILGGFTGSAISGAIATVVGTRTGASFMISGAFYIWGKLYPLLLVSQFWLVANVLFTTRQARRLFAPIGLGLILGGFTGSAISGAIATVVGTRTLLSPSAPPIHLVICPFVPSSDSFSFTELVAPVLGKHYRSVGFSGRLTSQWRN